MKTIIVWFRNDLRVHDHPALSIAVQDADHIIPLFIFNQNLLSGKTASANRNRFLLESLEDLKESLRKRGSDLYIRSGDASQVLQDLVRETGAEAIYYSADYTPYSIKRDKQVKADLDKDNTQFRAFPGRLIVNKLDTLLTKTGQPYKVFTPFWKSWQQVQRRELASSPQKLKSPPNLDVGSLPKLDDISKADFRSPDVLKGGETEGRKRLHTFLNDYIDEYHESHNDMAKDATSRLSSYLHFGCLSPLEIETMLPNSKGAAAWNRQLAWREFYNYVLYKFPDNTHREFQERYQNFTWEYDKKLLAAWQDGQTGYPVVDAAMRQLKQEGWMHNRARLIVGSFLTKDLLIDWREGEAHFMRWLLDGDMPNNNGNWQWIASVGVDPAPVFRRLYNPTSQQKNYDPTGAYVRRYVPELKDVPDEHLAKPWLMPDGPPNGYPRPVVDHKEARLLALERYRN